MENQEEKSMQDVMPGIEQACSPLTVGDIIKGKVLSVSEEEVMVSIDYITDGVIAKNEVSFDAMAKPADILQEGQELDVYVLAINDGQGNVALSYKRAIAETAWEKLQTIMEQEECVEITPKEVVKGGVVGYLEGLRAFVPASQLSLNYVEDLSCFIGEPLLVKVIELDKEKRKLIISHREIAKVEAEKKKTAFLETLVVGEKRTGTIARLANFGAFVDLGGVDGLIHVSDLSWDKVKHPGDVVSVGDSVTVTVLKFDLETGKISLSMKDAGKDPWFEKTAKYANGQIVEGKVVRLTDFGAFVELEPGLDGLVHISQIAEQRISTPSSVLSVGDQVKVKILEIKNDTKRLALSIKQAMEREETVEVGDYKQPENIGLTIGDLFKDKLKGFKFE